MQKELKAGLRGLGLDPARHPCDAYLQYIDLLARWNRAYNLTAIREPGDMLRRHVLESLALLPFLRGGRCLDVGTGAGLPGLILALAGPQRRWVLLDSNGKKIRFLQHALMTLSCSNAEAVQARMEDYAPAEPFTTIVSRALGPLDGFSRCARLLAPGGILLAVKGEAVEQEITEDLRRRMNLQVHALRTAEGKSTLVAMEPRDAQGGGRAG